VSLVAAMRGREAKVGLSVVALLAVAAFAVAPLLADPNASDFSLAPAADGGPPGSSARHWLGVDPLYRDELARLLSGGRISLLVASIATLVACAIGVAVGVAAAGLKKGGARWADGLLMRGVDVLLAFPFLLLVTLVGVLVPRSGLGTLVLVLGLTGWTGVARVVRARAAVVLEQDFVLAARAMGAGPLWIGVRHVLPNVLATAAALGASLAGSMILAEAVLGYLTVGLDPPDASWGRMLQEAESFIVLRPMLVALPAAFILVAMLGFHRLGEGLRLASGDGDQRPALVTRLPFPLDLMLVALGLGVVIALPRADLAPPAPAVATPDAPKRGGTLRLASSYGARTVDPALASDEMGVAIARMVCDRLVSLDDDGEIVPGLTRRATWADGGRALRLELEAGVRFQDGAQLEAADVKRSIERALGPNVPSPSAALLSGVVGFDAYRAGSATELSGVEVSAPLEVTIRLREPDATLPSVLTMPFVAPVCPSSPPPGAGAETAVCGAGPFRVTELDGEERVLLARHAGYFAEGRPYLDFIEILFRVRPQVQRYRFERGELDLVRELSSSDAALLRADRRYGDRLFVVKNLRTSAIFMNTERPPFDNPALRRAVSLAVDPTVLARLRPDITPIEHVVPPGVPGRPRGAVGRRFDLDAALEAMREAGYPYDPKTGEGGYPATIEYVVVPSSFEQGAAEVYQQQLAKIGIRLSIRLVGSTAYYALTQQRGKTTMGWAGWQADYADPLTFFSPNLESSAIGEVSQNYAFFSSAELDGILVEARRETDRERRRALFAEAERVVAEQAPWVPTFSPATLEVRQPWLFGYDPTALTALDFTTTYLAPGAGRAPEGAR
jgi:ABC-type transport system substrate-binding protein/ABC-type dipeptide/oligopeptide/nickel transport system permease subunit